MQIQDRKTKRKLEAWAGSLLYHSAEGEVDTDVLGRRLEGIIAPVMAPEAIQEAARKALTESPPMEAVADLKDKTTQWCTAEKMQELLA